MANELTKMQEQLMAVEFSADGALQMRTLGEAFCVARLLIASGFAPKGASVEGAVVSIMEGKRLGLDPLAAVQGIAAVNGRPTLWGDAMVAVVKASGLVEDEKVEWVPSHKEPQAVRYTVKRKGVPTPYVGEFSRLMAERAGLWGKPGPWKTNPDRMLLNRARTFALRDGFADVLKGMTSTEEARDAAREAVVTVEARPLPESEDLKALRARKRAPASALVAPAKAVDVPQSPAPEAVVSPDFEGDKPAPGDGGQYTHGLPSEPPETVPAGVGVDAQPDGGDFLD